jgi:hypothetical protein
VVGRLSQASGRDHRQSPRRPRRRVSGRWQVEANPVGTRHALVAYPSADAWLNPGIGGPAGASRLTSQLTGGVYFRDRPPSFGYFSAGALSRNKNLLRAFSHPDAAPRNGIPCDRCDGFAGLALTAPARPPFFNHGEPEFQRESASHPRPRPAGRGNPRVRRSVQRGPGSCGRLAAGVHCHVDGLRNFDRCLLWGQMRPRLAPGFSLLSGP